jgi:hypothetical protein
MAFVCVLLSCTGYKTTHYSTGGKFEKGRIVNGKKEGLWLSWHENGEKLSEYHYRKGELNGVGKRGSLTVRFKSCQYIRMVS